MPGCRPLTERLLSKVLRAASGAYQLRDRALIVMGVRTGFRIAELLSLRIGDVVRGGKFVEQITVKRRHMKGGRRQTARIESRSVPMHPDIPKALGPWLRQLRSMGYILRGDFLFQSRVAGNRPITRWAALRMLKKTCAAVGLYEGIGTHTLRKTFAAAVNRQLGGNIYLVAEALGHKDVNSAKAYLSFDRKVIDEAILSVGRR